MPLDLHNGRDLLWVQLTGGAQVDFEPNTDIHHTMSDLERTLHALKIAHDGLRRTFDEFEEARTHVGKDSLLSDAGKRSRLVALGTTALERIERWLAGSDDGSVIQRALDLAAELRASMKREELPDTAANATREAEVRALLRNRDAGENSSALLDAAAKGDALVYFAIIRAHDRDSLVFPDTLKEAQAQWTAKSDPERSAELKQIAKALEVVTSTRRAVVEHVKSTAGITDDSYHFVS